MQSEAALGIVVSNNMQTIIGVLFFVVVICLTVWYARQERKLIADLSVLVEREFASMGWNLHEESFRLRSLIGDTWLEQFNAFEFARGVPLRPVLSRSQGIANEHICCLDGTSLGESRYDHCLIYFRSDPQFAEQGLWMRRPYRPFEWRTWDPGFQRLLFLGDSDSDNGWYGLGVSTCANSLNAQHVQESLTNSRLLLEVIVGANAFVCVSAPQHPPTVESFQAVLGEASDLCSAFLKHL